MADPARAPRVERLLELVEAMAGRPVLVVADLVADRFIRGAPKRISREAPVLILRFEDESFVPGGGANAAANIAALGGRPLTLGVVGDDASGSELLATLRERGVGTEGVVVRKGYRTPTKTRILGGARHSIKQQIVRYDVEDRLEPGEGERDHFRRQLAAWTGQATVAVLSDYGYGSVEPALLPAVREALAEGGRVLCDSRYRLPDFRGLDGATPNEEEAEAIVGAPLGDEPGGVAAAGRRLLDRLAARFVLITRGSLGMSLVEPERAAAIPVHGGDQVADVTGAGDTVIGAFSLALAAGATTLEAALLANYAGGVVVMKAGTATLSADELAAAVRAGAALAEEIEWERS